MKRFLLTAITALILSSGTTWAESTEDVNAAAAYKRGDYAKVLEIVRPLAAQGYAKAQSNLGLLYQQGKGVPQDYAIALHWYHLAAAQGFAAAQFNLGNMYDTGVGVGRNYTEASKDGLNNSPPIGVMVG